jgi:hypothetical protein
VCIFAASAISATETVNFRPSPTDHPRELFEQLREFAVPHEEADLVVDLCIDGDIVEDFSIRRQSVELIKRKLQP